MAIQFIRFSKFIAVLSILIGVLPFHASATSHLIQVDQVIHAPAQVVWNLVRDPNDYTQWNSVLRAHTERVEPGQRIDLWIDLGSVLKITHSKEYIQDFDDTQMEVSWIRHFGCQMTTTRGQKVISEGPSQSHYYTYLKLPGILGGTLGLFGIDKILLKRFQEFGTALQIKAEEIYHSGALDPAQTLDTALSLSAKNAFFTVRY